MFKIRRILTNERILRWLDCYLSHRHQYVRIADKNSSSAPVHSGVPQGSVLGPLLFLVYLNDMSSESTVQCRFFADDCVAYLPIQSRTDHATLNEYLSVITAWCNSWKMSLNIAKCVKMTITRKKNPSEFTYMLNNTAITTVNQYKYLGLTITSNLSWKTHIEGITSAALRRLWFLKHRMRHCTSKTKLVAYTTLVRPLLEYADVVWDPHTQTEIYLLERVQNKSLRFIYHAYSRHCSVTELRNRSALPTLESRRKLHRLKFLYNIVNGHSGLAFNTYMQYNTSRKTRNKHDNTIVVPLTKTNSRRYSFFPRTISDWNELPHDVTSIAAPDAFLSAATACL